MLWAMCYGGQIYGFFSKPGPWGSPNFKVLSQICEVGGYAVPIAVSQPCPITDAETHSPLAAATV